MSVVSSDEEMDLPTIIKRFKIDLNIVKNDYADEPYISEEEYSNYKNGELEMENGPPPNFQYQNSADRYLIKNPKEANYCDPKRCDFYQTRIKHMYSRIVENAKKLLEDDGNEAANLEDVNPGEKCFVVGCLMKNGVHSTSGIEDFEGKEIQIRDTVSDEIGAVIIDFDAVLFEDIQQDEIMLKGNIDDFKGLTGFAVGIYGTLLNNDELYVEKVILPSLPPYIEPPLLEEDLFVIFVSGFSFFKKCSSIFRELNHFCNVLNSEKYYNKIARMIVICNNTTIVCSCDECTGLKHKWFEFDEDTLALRVANNLKKFFPHIDIDVMPGDLDSFSSTFPQQPMHKALFETYEIPSDAEFEDEEDKIEEIFRRRKRRHSSEDENNSDIEILEVVKPKRHAGVSNVSKESGINPILQAPGIILPPPTNSEIPTAVDDAPLTSDCEIEEEIIVCRSSPTPSEKRYSSHFSQETVILSDDSVNNDALDALDQHHREIYNEEYGIAVDNFLLNRVGRNPEFKRELNPVTNPYCFKVAGIEFHGTSGQNIDSLRNLTATKSTIELMNGIIEIGTILPTAPDSLDLFPYNNLKGKDPFAFEQLPHVFFAGNQNEFATEFMDYGNNQKVRFISIPKFEESYSMIAVNLKDLKTSQIKSRKRRPHLY